VAGIQGQLDMVAMFLVAIRKRLLIHNDLETFIIFMDRAFYNLLVNVLSQHMPEQAPKRVPKDALIHPFTFLGITCRVICDNGIGYSIGLIE
jgi:hypothetical protein